ncbi:hypothetical protein J11TS1_04630 [Oceanobacillus sp. J11TS1]|nr:hypothetical protein J11TS1_04630 [Oceanobacillus sp. J11TS1]
MISEVKKEDANTVEGRHFAWKWTRLLFINNDTQGDKFNILLEKEKNAVLKGIHF